MSSTGPPDPTGASSTGAKKKHRKKKNQKPQAQPVASSTDQNGSQPPPAESPDTNTPRSTSPKAPESDQDVPEETQVPVPNGNVSSHNDKPQSSPKDNTEASPALESMAAERDSLKTEVEELRKQLESIQASHEDESQKLKEELEESEAAREEAEENYQGLRERVSQIKGNLADRLQRDKEQLEEARTRIEELETTNDDLLKANKTLSQEAASFKEDLDDAERELTSVRSRNNLSQTNWHRERDDLVRLHVQTKEELAATTSAMGEWEVIAMEERSRRESLGDKMSELEEQATSLREALDRMTEERDTHAMAVDGLQRALQEIQDARKHELREMVESTEAQLADMRKAVAEAEIKAAESGAEKTNLVAEVERMAPFEQELKEKNLLLGKTRHQNIVMSDHLTRSLRYLKKVQPGDQISRELISNSFIQFLTLDRADPKRFDILKVISLHLAWTDDEMAKVGLRRSGAPSSTSNTLSPASAAGGAGNSGGGGGFGSLRFPYSPFHRTPSTPSLNTEFFTEEALATTSSSGDGESLADLWAGFLARGAQEADAGRGSVSSSVGGSGSGNRPGSSAGAADGTR